MHTALATQARQSFGSIIGMVSPAPDALGPDVAALRRHAETLTGSRTSADAYIEALLEILATDSTILAAASDRKVGLFKLYSRLYANLFSRDAVERGMLSVCRARQAMSLVLANGFSTAQAAEIMDVTAPEIEAMVRVGSEAGILADAGCCDPMASSLDHAWIGAVSLHN